MIAIGDKARQMYGKTHEGIKIIRPLRNGVIADFDAALQMIKGMIKMINKCSFLFTHLLRIVVSIPSGCTEIERRAVRDLSEHVGGRIVYMIYEPMAAAIGKDIDVEAPEGSMIVDIGDGITEIAVIALGGIVCNQSLSISGDNFTSDIQTYIRDWYNIKIGEKPAEAIEIGIGSALPELENPPPEINIRGPDILSAMLIEIPISYQEMAYCLSVMEQTPPELYADIVKRGIHLVGGSSLIRGFDKRFTDKVNIPFHVAEDPLQTIVRGTGIALKNVDKFSLLYSDK
jgi:rod shape-determining protein MreB